MAKKADIAETAGRTRYSIDNGNPSTLTVSTDGLSFAESGSFSVEHEVTFEQFEEFQTATLDPAKPEKQPKREPTEVEVRLDELSATVEPLLSNLSKSQEQAAKDLKSTKAQSEANMGEIKGLKKAQSGQGSRIKDVESTLGKVQDDVRANAKANQKDD